MLVTKSGRLFPSVPFLTVVNIFVDKSNTSGPMNSRQRRETSCVATEITGLPVSCSTELKSTIYAAPHSFVLVICQPVIHSPAPSCKVTSFTGKQHFKFESVESFLSFPSSTNHLACATEKNNAPSRNTRALGFISICIIVFELSFNSSQGRLLRGG